MNSWSQSVCLQAIVELEKQYQRIKEPCLALLIARNYANLQQFKSSVEQQEYWADRSLFWRKQYLKNRQPSFVVGFDFI